MTETGGTVAGIILRGKTWHFRWVLPDEYRPVAGKGEIHKSLKTDSRKEATIRATELERELRARYEAVLAGRAPMGEGLDRFSAAVRIAQGLGLTYRSAQEIAGGNVEDILARVEVARKEAPDAIAHSLVAAVLGGVEQPGLRLSGLPDHVEELATTKNHFKNATQMRKWRGGIRRSISQAIEAIGEDVLVRDFSRSHAKKHRDWLEKRVVAGEITPDTMKKELTYASSCFARYYNSLDIEDPPRPYARVSVSKEVAELDTRTDDERRKRELDDDWIRDTLLAPGTLDGLNPEARDILLIAVESGCRQSEIYNTPLDHIFVDDEYPHFLIRAVAGHRQIKNKASARTVPLVGVALSAMRRVVARGGFKRYAGKDSWSAAVNEYLRDREALPETGLTIGGLRHSWEGRMKRAGVAIDDRGVMMGHSVKIIRGRESYGDFKLEHRYALAAKLAIDAPDPVAHLGEGTITAPRKPRKKKPAKTAG